jgi:hypothetical protein
VFKLGRVVFIAAILGSTALAQEPPALPPTALQYLVAKIQPGATLENALQIVRAEFRRLEANGDGKVDDGDVVLHDEIAAALSRNMLAQEIMSADLDGDGTVTAEELRRKKGYDARMRQASAGAGVRTEHDIRF